MVVETAVDCGAKEGRVCADATAGTTAQGWAGWPSELPAAPACTAAAEAVTATVGKPRSALATAVAQARVRNMGRLRRPGLAEALDALSVCIYAVLSSCVTTRRAAFFSTDCSGARAAKPYVLGIYGVVARPI